MSIAQSQRERSKRAAANAVKSIRNPQTERGKRTAAWAVHLLTASGAFWGFLALLAIDAEAPRWALMWLGMAFIVDGVDGSLARWYNVESVLADFEGGSLDLIVDYFTYVIIPAYFIYQLVELPTYTALICAAIILLTSQYHFGDKAHKTEDNYFQGFAALWNVIVFYIFLLNPNPYVSLLVIVGLGVLTFVPVQIVHPFRVSFLRRTTLTITALWGLFMFAALFVDTGNRWNWASLGSVACLGYLVLVSVWRSWRAKRDEVVV